MSQGSIKSRIQQNNGELSDAITEINNLPDALKVYSSVSAMNEDIENINTGEIVKVESSGSATFYIKEPGTQGQDQPVNWSNYNDGDTISLKGKKLAQSFTSTRSK